MFPNKKDDITVMFETIYEYLLNPNSELEFSRLFPRLSQNEILVLNDLFSEFDSVDKNTRFERLENPFRWYKAAQRNEFVKFGTTKRLAKASVFDKISNNIILGKRKKALFDGVKNYIVQSALMKKGTFWKLYAHGTFSQIAETEMNFILGIIGKHTGHGLELTIVEQIRELEEKTMAYILQPIAPEVSPSLACEAFRVLEHIKFLLDKYNIRTRTVQDQMETFMNLQGTKLDNGLKEVIHNLFTLWNVEELEIFQVRRRKALQLYIDARNGVFDKMDDNVHPLEFQLQVQYYVESSNSFWLCFVLGIFENVKEENLAFILSIIGRDASCGEDLWDELEERVAKKEKIE